MKYKPLQQGERIDQSFLEQLNAINARRTQSFKKYVQELLLLADCQSVGLTEKHKIFLGGFIRGEGNLNVSAKKGKGALFGLYLDLEFSVTQHANRICHLINLLHLFQCGRIGYKSGSNATLVFRISDRTSLEQKVVPYWQKYVLPYSKDRLTEERLQGFAKLLSAFRLGQHKSLAAFRESMVPLWEEMRSEKGQSHSSFANLGEALEHISTHMQSRGKV